MNCSELDARLREIQEKGFDESFPGFCAREFSSLSYPPENLLPAGMHAYYLREALSYIMEHLPVEASLEAVPEEEILQAAEAYADRKSISLENPLEVSHAIGWACYHAALGSGGDFCRLFVNSWCHFFSASA